MIKNKIPCKYGEKTAPRYTFKQNVYASIHTHLHGVNCHVTKNITKNITRNGTKIPYSCSIHIDHTDDISLGSDDEQVYVYDI